MKKSVKENNIREEHNSPLQNGEKRTSSRIRNINEKTPSSNRKKKESNMELMSVQNSSYRSLRTPRSSDKKILQSPSIRILERKRSLFNKSRNLDQRIDEENEEVDLLKAIAPLSPNVNNTPSKATKKVFRQNNDIENTYEKSDEEFISTPKHYLSLTKKRTLSSKKKLKISLTKYSSNKKLYQIFNDSQKTSNYTNNLAEEIVSSADEDEKRKQSFVPKSKSFSNTKNVKNTKSASPDLQISTRSFYSNKKNDFPKEPSQNIKRPLNISPSILKIIPQLSPQKNYKTNKINKRYSGSGVSLGNKGVGHSIRRKNIKIKNKLNKSIDDFLKTIKCEKLKSLPSKRISLEKVEEVHKILNTTANPIKMARPLNINFDKDINSRFSDSNDSDTDVEDNSSNIENQGVISNVKIYSLNNSPKKILMMNSDSESNSPTKVKKFFKSGHSSAKEVRITENIKLGLSCGKMSLLSKKKNKLKKRRNSNFLNEQAAVNDIIKSLTNSPEANNLLSSTTEGSPNSDVQCLNFLDEEIIDEIYNEASTSNTLKPQNELYEEFRKRIPYKTNDSNEIERQHLLLDFLIANNICSEKNFEIFISDPDNHKAEADEIINNMVEIVNNDEHNIDQDINLDPYEHYRNQIPYNTDDPLKGKEQEILLEFLIENNACSEENFTIFIKELDFRKDEAEKIIENISNSMDIEETVNNETENNIKTKTPSPAKKEFYPIFYSGKKYIPIEKKFSREKNKNKLWKGALGQNQYQIDAGQKEFGSKQCSICGLVYTLHEPEEEIIHKEYHNSMYFLKFRGWIDEDVIGKYFEWSNDGRIIRITSSEHAKKKERLMELLKIVDKELGFASYILPENYVAFLAVRKNQFVGLCLVQFLSQANRYVKVNGVDCCSEDHYDAKIGISRIWVSPLCRRMGIASKLILAARTHTIVGNIIDIDKIAFSAPTEEGKIFAQKICRRTDFLVYQ